MSYRRRFGLRTFGRPRFGYRRGYNRYWRRNWSRSSVLARQRNSTRSFTVCVPVEDVYTLTIAANAHYSNLLRCVPCQMMDGTNATDDNRRQYAQSMLLSQLFKTYVNLYDQMKINWVRHTCGVGLQLGGAGATAVKIYTAWDRRLTINEQLITFDDMMNGPESTAQMFVENSRPQVMRYCGARDLIEKAQYFDAKTTISTNQYQAMHAWRSASSNVNFFCPAFYLGIMTADTVGTTRTIPISVSSVYSITFRQPRYGLSGAAAKGAVEDTRDLVGGLDAVEAEESDIVSKVPETEVKPVKVGDVWYMQCSDGILRPLEISGKDGSEMLEDDATIIDEKKG